MDDLLEQRQQTHGDFIDVALVAQATKDIWRAGAGWKNLSPVQREGLEMIAHKIARIICGNSNHLGPLHRRRRIRAADHREDEMILPAQAIRKIKPVSPFCERTRYNGMTFGLGPAGYDVRIAETVVVDAKSVLASTLEHFDMPNDVLGQVCDKSTWARRGVAVQNTIIEPGWRGYLTVELTNHSGEPIEIQAGDPIAQIIFFRLEAPTELPYQGKYQDQQAGPQPARREPSVESLRWFGAWKKSSWEVGEKPTEGRQAYASGRGGRYRILRKIEGFIVSYYPPYKCPDEPWEEIGRAATQEAAIALAQAHNDHGRRCDGRSI
jgi:dCTP deaminase